MTQQNNPPAARPGPRFRELKVVQSTFLTPHMKRLTLAGEGLSTFTPAGPATHFKMFFPQPGFERTVVPDFDADNRPVMPEGIPRPISRTYTPRSLSANGLELDVDFVMHGVGVGSDWATNAKVGDYITIGSGGRSFFQIDPALDWHVIIGDESALPAIGTILDALPEGVNAHVYSEVIEQADEQELDSKANLEFTWIHRGEKNTLPGKLLMDSVCAAQLPREGRGHIYVACEAGIMREFRKHFIEDLGIDRTQITTRGYWKWDASNHPDNDYGIDS
jgi:NADPH-dependent ferric siderophore reductase